MNWGEEEKSHVLVKILPLKCTSTAKEDNRGLGENCLKVFLINWF